MANGCGSAREVPLVASNCDEPIPSTSRTVDLGKTALNHGASWTFNVLNTSNLPFMILSVDKSCSCIALDLEVNRKIEPMTSVEIPVSLSSESVGRMKAIVVITTDSELEEFRTIRLELTAEFPQAISTEPRNLVFRANQDGQFARQSLRLSSEMPGLLENYRELNCPKFLSVELVSQSSRYIDFEFSIDKAMLDSDWALGLVAFKFADNRCALHHLTAKCEAYDPKERLTQLNGVGK